jgi:predicted benzoate:H+ symporter BenE
MKYLAVCVLSVLTMLSASASPVSPSAQLLPSLIVPATRAAQGVRGAVDEVATGVPDSLLMAMLGGALIALQLRRRQKSLRSPRLAIMSN